ncbi:PEGA domain-containing protein [Patescibacteria group bacterium]|nr:PEGA domain-containing protein [Patescibacteria group bacterium]
MTMWTIKGEKGITGNAFYYSDWLHMSWYIIMPDGSIRRPDFGAKLEGDIPATWVNPEGEDRIGIIRGDTVFFKHDFSLVPYASPDSTNSMIYPISQVDVSYPNGTGYTARISLKEVLAPKTWTIKGEKGMTGTVEQIGYLLWHITSPVKLDIAYGGPDAVPGTYVDALGRDQMVAIEKDVASKGVYLDENYTGDLGEMWYPQDNVTITYPNGTDYTARVSVISPPGTGSLYINSTPGEADIIINGQLQGVKTPATITDLSAGSYEVKLTKTGYQDITQTVTIIAGTTTYMDVSLTVLPGISTLKISSTPAGARVFIKDMDTEKVTPATITNLSSGNYTYKLVLAGYKDATGTFTMVLGKNTMVSVIMTKPEAAVGTGTILGISLLGLGVLGAVIVATRRKKPEYTVPGFKER